MHPMFGPESGKHGWGGLPCVYEQVRVGDHHRAARLLALFEEEGCRMVRMSCERHDQLASASQFVTHLTGRLLAKLKLQPNPIATKGFTALLDRLEHVQGLVRPLLRSLQPQCRLLRAAPPNLRRLRRASIRPPLVRSGGSGAPASAGDGVLSSRVRGLAMSKTVQVTDLAAALRLRGSRSSRFLCEPDFVGGAGDGGGARGAHQGLVKYTENAGSRGCARRLPVPQDREEDRIRARAGRVLQRRRTDNAGDALAVRPATRCSSRRHTGCPTRR